MNNYKTMSERASTELDDAQTIRILICYLLYRISKPIDAEELYDIAVSTEIINYFAYQDSIDYLISNGSVNATKNGSSVIYSLTQKGTECAKTLRSYTPKSYRDKIVSAALKYFAQQKYQNEVQIEYIKLEKGYYVQCRCLDINNDLMDLKLYAPDLGQAELLGKNIMKNPTGFYGKILSIALNNQEEEFDPEDL